MHFLFNENNGTTLHWEDLLKPKEDTMHQVKIDLFFKKKTEIFGVSPELALYYQKKNKDPTLHPGKQGGKR
jgi:hypothetical protein